MHHPAFTVARRRAARFCARGLLIAGLAAALAGCNTTTATDTTGGIPIDYRDRHPIAVKEGKKALTLFVGAGRGGLSAMQRAEVLAFAQNWKRDATGGVTIDRPVGGANERAVNDTLKEALSIIVQAGVPNSGIGIQPYQAGGEKNPTLRLNYPLMVAKAGPCGLWPDDLGPSNDPKHFENRPVLQPRLRHAAQSRRDGREPARPRAAARRKPALHGQAHLRRRQMAQGREPGDHLSGFQQGRDQRSGQMIRTALQTVTPEPEAPQTPARDEHIAPAPRVSVQAFCETVETAAAIQSAGEDRRLGKAHVKIQMGGVAAAIEAYRGSPTPNVIMLETEGRGDSILTGLDSLAEFCDAGTRVIVIGRTNDVMLYRELVRRGVSDYMISPVVTLDVVRSICGLFSAPDAKPVGRIIAVVGAKGGVGASTVAHNIAWAVARDLALDSVVTDLDLAFGTAGLDYNQDPPQGIADAVFSPDRIDTAFIDRLLSKCSDHLSLLAAPATLERAYDFGAEAFDGIFDALRATMPCVVLDVPHQWNGWTQRTLVSADEILIVAEPDLANLRNAKNLFDYLRTARLNDHRPFYCLNRVGVPKRPEIKPADFAKALEDRAGGGAFRSSRNCSAPPPTTAR